MHVNSDSKIKILIVSYFFPPDDAIGGQRLFSWAKSFVNLGLEVEVLTIKKDKPYDGNYGFIVHEVKAWSFYELIKKYYRNNIKKTEVINSTPYVGWKSRLVKWLKAKGLGSSTRMPDPSDLWIYPSIKYIKNLDKRWDVVISSFGPYSAHIIGAYLKKNNIAMRWICDFRDMWTLNPYFKGFPFFKTIELILEKNLVKNCDAILTVSDPLSEQLKFLHYYSKVHTVENGFDLDDYTSPIETINTKRINLRKRIVYTGSIYPGRRDPTPLFNVLKYFEANELELVFAGPLNEELINTVNRLGINAFVTFLGKVSKKESIELQKSADILLFLESNKPDAVGILTGKLFEYLYSGKEIWGIGIDETTISGKLIIDSGAGYAIGSNEKLIFEKVNRLIKLGTEQVFVNHEMLKKFDRRNQAKEVLKIIKSIL